MLSAHCVCATLNAEHAVMRQTLANLDDLLCETGWRNPGAMRDRVQSLLNFMALFEETCHGPKEHELELTLKGRSADADQLIAQMVLARKQGAELLSLAGRLLQGMEIGDTLLADQFIGVLSQHRSDTLRYLQDEERSLWALARQLLGEDEWARIASDISWIPTLLSPDEAPGLPEPEPPKTRPARLDRRPMRSDFQSSSWT